MKKPTYSDHTCVTSDYNQHKIVQNLTKVLISWKSLIDHNFCSQLLGYLLRPFTDPFLDDSKYDLSGDQVISVTLS